MNEYMMKAVVDEYNKNLAKSEPVQKSRFKKSVEDTARELVYLATEFEETFPFAVVNQDSNNLAEIMDQARRKAKALSQYTSSDHSVGIEELLKDLRYARGKYSDAMEKIANSLVSLCDTIQAEATSYEASASKKARKSKVRKAYYWDDMYSLSVHAGNVRRYLEEVDVFNEALKDYRVSNIRDVTEGLASECKAMYELSSEMLNMLNQ